MTTSNIKGDVYCVLLNITGEIHSLDWTANREIALRGVPLTWDEARTADEAGGN